MSNTIDTRVVEMKFDNAAFERGIASTLKSLANLKSGLKLDGAASGLNEVNKAASRFSLANIARVCSRSRRDSVRWGSLA